MLNSQIGDLCLPKQINAITGKRITLGLDIVTSIALLVIGALAVASIIPMPAPAAWAILGAGAAYTTSVVLHGLKMVHLHFKKDLGKTKTALKKELESTYKKLDSSKSNEEQLKKEIKRAVVDSEKLKAYEAEVQELKDLLSKYKKAYENKKIESDKNFNTYSTILSKRDKEIKELKRRSSESGTETSEISDNSSEEITPREVNPQKQLEKEEKSNQQKATRSSSEEQRTSSTKRQKDKKRVTRSSSRRISDGKAGRLARSLKNTIKAPPKPSKEPSPQKPN